MIDREKVIKGLECCTKQAEPNCFKCPYSCHCEEGDTWVIKDDALTLLKEQERKDEKCNALQYELIQLKTKLKEQEEQYNNLAEWAEGHIVFCKDCRLSKIEKVFKHVPESKETVRWCELIQRCVDDEWFCADGRRR